MVARCDRSWCSTSATLTAKCWRSAEVRPLTTWRFCLSERTPGIRRSNRSTATTTALDAAGDLFDLVGLDDVAVLEVLIVLQADAALVAVANLADVVLEPAERRDLAVVDDDAVAHETRPRVASDRARPDVAPRDDAELRHPEGLPDLRLAEDPLALLWFQQAGQ